MQTIELAEGIEIHLRAAGPFLRFLAYLLDLMAELGILLLFGFLIGLMSPAFGGNVSAGVWMLGFFVIWWFYHVIFELSPWGATPGKKAFGLRVVDESGSSITLGASMVRNFIRGVEIFFPFLALVPFFHPRFQRLGDLAAGSLVVYSRPRSENLLTIPPPMTSVPVNFSLTREEEAALVSFRHRSASWSEARRVELANHLAKMTGERGERGVGRVLGMAYWLEERR